LCATPVVFDQTPPTAVQGLRISHDGSTLIQWNPTTCPAFKEYVVGASVSSDYLLNTASFRDTLRDRASTSWRINTSAFPPGAKIIFTIAVDNGAQLGPWSYAEGIVGTAIPIASPVLRFWNHPTRNETYAWTQEGRMYVLDSKGDSVLRVSGFLPSGNAIFSHDGSRFFVFNSSARTIAAFSVNDFAQVLPSIILPSEVSTYSSAVASPNGRFYVGNHDGTIWAIDQNTGSVVGSLVLAYNAWDTPRMIASRDSTYLYCTDKLNGISKINIRNATPVVERRADIGGSVFALDLSPNEQYLIASHYGGASVYLLDPTDLSLAAELMLPGPPCYREYYSLDSYTKAFICEGSSLFVASHYRYITQFDLTSRTVVNRWCVITDPRALGVARDGRSVLCGALTSVPSPNLLIRR
jgi:DNA-binding beta-propeller fold protein YncE